MVRILVFGDSIAYGAWDKEGGWPARLKKFIHEKNLSDENFYCLLYNLSISGDTTEDLLKRFESEAVLRIEEDEETIIIFAIGINDAHFIHSKNALLSTPEEFRENIQKLILKAKKYSEKIFFVGPTPVGETKTNPLSWNKDKSFKNQNIKINNQILKEECEKNKVWFIEVFEEMQKAGLGKIIEYELTPGLHPNTAGHEMIFEIVKRNLLKEKLI